MDGGDGILMTARGPGHFSLASHSEIHVDRTLVRYDNSQGCLSHVWYGMLSAWACYDGPRNYLLSVEKTPDWSIVAGTRRGEVTPT